MLAEELVAEVVRLVARDRERERRSRQTQSSPDSASFRPPTSPRAPASRWTTGSSSTSTAARAVETTCSPPGTSRASPFRRSEGHAGSSTRITQTRTGGPSARTWRGAQTPYDHLPFFYSDLFDLGYEAVGDVDSRLDSVDEWAEPNRKGVVAYVDGDGKARGFLLWDVWGKVDSARELIEAGTTVDAAALRALID